MKDQNKDDHSSNDVCSNASYDAPEILIIPDEDEHENLEPWHEWIQRTTRLVEDSLKKLSIENWVTKVRRRQWRMATRLIRQSKDRWSRLVLEWDPEIHFDGTRPKAHRKQSRPKKRWEDDFNHFLKTVFEDTGKSWQHYAQDLEVWTKLEDQYAKGEWISELGART